MKTFMNTFGGILVVLGLMAVAGSGGDCDGKCGPGNEHRHHAVNSSRRYYCYGSRWLYDVLGKRRCLDYYPSY